MFRFVVLFALVCSALAEDDILTTPFGRIVNGERASIEQFPYQVSIQTTKGSHFCGGALIGPYHVVTAAHCMQSYPAKNIAVRAGSSLYNSGGKLVGVKTFKYHEKYNAYSQIYDIAIIKLKSPIYESSTIQYVSLAEKAPVKGTRAVVSGWGVTCYYSCTSASKYLKQVSLTIIDRFSCQNDYEYEPGTIGKTTICAYENKKDACQGDSGGPLVANGELAGVVSWGQGCAWTGYPGVYADVAFLKSWIDKTVKQL